MDPHPLKEAIDEALFKAQDRTHRRHLGASVIGDECARKLWYSFRWASKIEHPARILRLFDRGKLEESRIVAWLEMCGVQVWQIDPATQKQFRISGYLGHFGGELDGVGKGVLHYGPYLLEFKTHNDKSFDDLVKNGLIKSKPLHHIQMQMYMGAMKLLYGIYIAINKNTDDLYIETTVFSQEVYDKYSARAKMIIDAPEPPARISRDPTFWVCKFCDHRAICHLGEEPQVNCRTCAHSTPVEGGVFQCERPQPVSPAPIDFLTEETGCDYYARHPME